MFLKQKSSSLMKMWFTENSPYKWRQKDCNTCVQRRWFDSIHFQSKLQLKRDCDAVWEEVVLGQVITLKFRKAWQDIRNAQRMANVSSGELSAYSLRRFKSFTSDEPEGRSLSHSTDQPTGSKAQRNGKRVKVSIQKRIKNLGKLWWRNGKRKGRRSPGWTPYRFESCPRS